MGMATILRRRLRRLAGQRGIERLNLRVTAPLVEADVRRADEATPLLGLVGDELAELSG